KRIYDELVDRPDRDEVHLDDIFSTLDQAENLVVESYQSMFVEQIQSFRRKVLLFGLHFASIDIRQDSRVIARALETVTAHYPDILPADFASRPESEQIDLLFNCKGDVSPDITDDPVLRDTLESMAVIRQIQKTNGERGAHRYIISNCRGPLDIARVMALFRLCGWGDDPVSVDIVPLFETISDLQGGGESMENLYANSLYQKHLAQRGKRQTVMLGFSDGTKDGGYLMANWAIYSAKENITSASRAAGVEVIFFDG